MQPLSASTLIHLYIESCLFLEPRADSNLICWKWLMWPLCLYTTLLSSLFLCSVSKDYRAYRANSPQLGLTSG